MVEAWTKSIEQSIDISVLQGSILGPILFLCFINDLHLATWLLTLLFADDTAVVDSDTDLPTLISRVNIEIQKIANWFRTNKMAVNVSKNKYILFRPRGQKIQVDLDENGVLQSWARVPGFAFPRSWRFRHAGPQFFLKHAGTQNAKK